MLTLVAVDDGMAPLGRQAEQGGRNVRHRRGVVVDKDVEPAVVVVVEEPGRETAAGGLGDTRVRGDVDKGTVPQVAIETILGKVRDIEIGITVVVEVAPGGALGKTLIGDPRLPGDVGKGTVAVVAKQL